MNDRPRQNPAYRLTRYAPRQGGFPPYLTLSRRIAHGESAVFLDHFEFKIII